MATRPSRYGMQPIGLIMFERGLSVRRAAAELGIDYSKLWKATRGHSTPGPDVRAALPAYLDIPLDALFTAESLAVALSPQLRYRDPAGVR